MDENDARRPISGWITDPAEPSGFRWLPDMSVIDDTTALPAVAGRVEYAGHIDYPLRWPWFSTDDGSAYERADPDQFDNFDDVDSTTIVDDGAPG